MMKQYFKFCLLLLVCCGCLVGCRSKINDGIFRKIRDGMSLQEVEGVLGGPGTAIDAKEIFGTKDLKLPELPKIDPTAKNKMLKSIPLDKIEKGKEAVQIPMMDPKDVMDSIKAYRWIEGNKSITLIFQADRLIRKMKNGF